MAATWIPAWRVSPDGEQVTEYRVSLTDYSVTVRKVGQTRGGERYPKFSYEHHFAPTREAAIEKFIERQTVVFGKMRAEMELAQLMIKRGEKLRDQPTEAVQ